MLIRSVPRRVAAAGVVVGGAVLLGACTDGPDVFAEATDTSTTSTSAPSETGAEIDSSTAAALEEVVTSTMDELVVPGAVVLVATPEDEWFEAFGTRTFGGGEPMIVDDHFRVGSNTKTMTGTVILQLADEGVLSVDDPVSDHRPDVPNGENITIGQLLDMRSGLASYSTLDSFNAALDEEPRRVWDPEELIAMALAEPPAFEPGAGFLYSNTNTVLLGRIIEELTGMSYAENVRQRIIEPLGLDNTVLPETDSNALPQPHPSGYMWGTNLQTNAEPELPEPDLSAALDGSLRPNDHTFDNPSWGWSAGSLISTARDLQIYVDKLVNGGLLEERTQAARLASVQPASDEPGAAQYGWAMAQLGPLLGHDGSLPGFQSVMGHDPETGTTVIVLTNIQASPDGQQTANVLAQRILGVLGDASSGDDG